MSKTLVLFSSVGLNLPHLGLEMEALSHLRPLYDNLELVSCNITMPSCYLNPTHNLIACAACKARTDHGLKKLFAFDKEHHPPKKYAKNVTIDDYYFENIDQLMELSYNDIDYGRGIASSLISIYRNSNLNLRPLEDLVTQWANWCVAFIDFLPSILSQDTDVLMFNGRFFEAYPLKSYCEQNGITYYTHEKGSDFSKFQLIKNSTVHSLETRDAYMRQLWYEGPPEKKEVAIKWFEDKRQAKAATEINFTKEQTRGKLPADWNQSKHNIVIFNSSEDEFKSIKEWNHDLYSSQNQLVTRLAKSVVQHKHLHFSFRFHPNLARLADDMLAEIRSAALPNLTIIGPTEKIDSYALLNNADKVLTFGSRMSIEAAFAQIPSITYGKSFYNKLTSLYVPTNFDQLQRLITDKGLLPKEGEDYLMAAYFLLERGQKCTKTKIKSTKDVTYIAEKLSTSKTAVVLNIIRNLDQLKIWKTNKRLFRDKSLLNDLFEL